MSQSPPTGTKRLLLDTALRMIQEKSYNSFSLQELAERTKIKKASIYYHFSSKEDLIAKAMRHYHEKVIYLTKKLNSMTENSWERLDNYFKFFENFINQNLICPATVIGSEVTAVPLEVSRELNLLFDYYAEWLTELFEFGEKNGEFNLHNSPRDTATHFESSVAGATILARSYGKTEYFQTVKEVLMRSISPDGQINESKNLISSIQV